MTEMIPYKSGRARVTEYRHARETIECMVDSYCQRYLFRIFDTREICRCPRLDLCSVL